MKAIRNSWTLQKILDEAAVDEETNRQATEIEKKISPDGRKLKRVEQPETSKPCRHLMRVYTRKNVQQSELVSISAPRAGNKTTTPVFAAVNKPRILEARNTVNREITFERNIQNRDAMPQDRKGNTSHRTATEKFARSCVTMNLSGSPISATHRAKPPSNRTPAQIPISWMNFSFENSKHKDRKWHFSPQQSS